jgi:nucleotidyltransferase/DNA polymerase involved in DNA repair
VPWSLPLVLVQILASRRIIAHACPIARKAGVRQDMPLAEARALCPKLVAYPYEPHKDLRSLRALARRMIRFSPSAGLEITSADPPVYLPAIFLDVTGCQRLYGGWGNLLEQVAEDLDDLHFHHRLAIAPTPGAAWAVAACNKMVPASSPAHDECADEGTSTTTVMVISPDKLRDTLAPLPVESLRIEPQTIAALHHLGLETIGQILAIPRSQLPSRFGPQLLLRIDQAIGLIPEPIVPLRPEAPIEACIEFDGVIDSPEIILRTVEMLVGRICDDLARRGHGVRRLDLRLHRLHAPAVTREVLFSRPSRNPKNILRLLARAIEMLEVKFNTKTRRREANSVRDDARAERNHFPRSPIVATNRHPERTREGSGHEIQSQMLREYAQHDNCCDSSRLQFSRINSHAPRANRPCHETVLEPEGFSAISLHVLLREPVTDEQFSLDNHSEESGRVHVDRMVENLTLRLGESAITHARLVKSHLPERAFTFQPGPPPVIASEVVVQASSLLPDACADWKPASQCHGNSAATNSAHSAFASSLRPLLLYSHPIELQVLVAPSHDREGRPVSFNLSGRVRHVVHAVGPERIAGLWWEHHYKTRDYFAVEDDSARRWWLFRVRDSHRWFLHGEFA